MRMIYRLALPFILLMLTACEQTAAPAGQIYPWQITRLPEGDSKVFGITLNHSGLEVAEATLGTRHDAALFENRDGSLSLEVYYNEVTLGGLSGKFILTLAAPRQKLEDMRQRAVKSKRMDSGAVRYRLALDDRHALREFPISAISYIPYTDLDEEMIRQRFGTPGEIIDVKGGRHLLYPEQGLDLLLDSEGKELLQYVAPKDFERLSRPLLRPSDS